MPYLIYKKHLLKHEIYFVPILFLYYIGTFISMVINL